MGTSLLILILWLGLSGTPALGQTPPPNAPDPCTQPVPRGTSWEVGLALQSLIPTHLPDFATSVPAYGPTLGIPFLGNTIHVQAVYGADKGLSLQVAEVGYRINMRSPYLSGFVLAGGHFLHYSESGKNHQFWGAMGGVGFTFSMAEHFEMVLSMKAYFQGNPMLSLGGGFSILL